MNKNIAIANMCVQELSQSAKVFIVLQYMYVRRISVG